MQSYRESKRITLLEMARELGLKTAGGYARIEKGEVKLKAEQVPIIANKLDLSLKEVVALFIEKEEVK
nr:helix-turn-helix transcriptional regulator [Polycladospora coralii]